MDIMKRLLIASGALGIGGGLLFLTNNPTDSENEKTDKETDTTSPLATMKLQEQVPRVPRRFMKTNRTDDTRTDIDDTDLDIDTDIDIQSERRSHRRERRKQKKVKKHKKDKKKSRPRPIHVSSASNTDISEPEVFAVAAVAKPDVVEDVKEPKVVEDVKESDVAVAAVAKPEVVEDVNEPEVVAAVAKPEVVEDVNEPEVVEDVKEPESVSSAIVVESENVESIVEDENVEDKDAIEEPKVTETTVVIETLSDSDSSPPNSPVIKKELFLKKPKVVLTRKKAERKPFELMTPNIDSFTDDDGSLTMSDNSDDSSSDASGVSDDEIDAK
jgi:hypothetical protein